MAATAPQRAAIPPSHARHPIIARHPTSRLPSRPSGTRYIPCYSSPFLTQRCKGAEIWRDVVRCEGVLRSLRCKRMKPIRNTCPFVGTTCSRFWRSSLPESVLPNLDIHFLCVPLNAVKRLGCGHSVEAKYFSPLPNDMMGNRSAEFGITRSRKFCQ